MGGKAKDLEGGREEKKKKDSLYSKIKITLASIIIIINQSL